MDEPVWTLEDAAARFRELAERARAEGPQHVAGAGVVVMSEAEFARRVGMAGEDGAPLGQPGPYATLGEAILRGPSLEGLDLKRDRSGMRDVSFE